MGSKLGRYAFVMEIDPVDLGGAYDHLPLHCTLMHWFITDLPHQELCDILRRAMMPQHSYVLVSDTVALYGKNLDRPVYTIATDDSLMSLHSRLFLLLHDQGVKFTNPEYVGSGYHPHVTNRSARSFPTGSQKLVERIYLAEALGGTTSARKVVAVIPLPIPA